MGETLDRT